VRKVDLEQTGALQIVLRFFRGALLASPSRVRSYGGMANQRLGMPCRPACQQETGTAGEVLEMKRLASIYVDIPVLRPGTVGAYALALLSAAVALALRVAIDPYVVGVEYITFFPAVIITALISGFRAGLLCVILSAAATDFFLLPPRWSFYIEHPGVGAR
jgi:Domain of unknown function (DUF4118)